MMIMLTHFKIKENVVTSGGVVAQSSEDLWSNLSYLYSLLQTLECPHGSLRRFMTNKSSQTTDYYFMMSHLVSGSAAASWSPLNWRWMAASLFSHSLSCVWARR